MGTLSRFHPRSSSQLLTRILDRPELMAAVPELPVPVLAALIERVGLDDAAELVALASPAQLERVIDEDVWLADAPGAEERFSPERFARWLHVLLEGGEDHLVRRLCEMPRELLALAIHRLVRVVYASALEMAGDDETSAPVERFDEYALIARDRDAWDDVWTCLVALDGERHDLLRWLLERCAELDDDIETFEDDGLHDVVGFEHVLEDDAAAEREERRSARGYVSHADARGFLELARRRGDGARSRDPIARAYFRALADDDAEPVPAAAAPPAATRRAGSTQLTVARPDVGGLMALLQDADETSTSTDEATAFDAVMSGLAVEQPELFATRLEELGFLANALITGGSHAGRSLAPAPALEAAIAACNLGLSALARADASHEQARQVVRDTPADDLFRRGYRVLYRAIQRPAQACLLALSQRANDRELEREVRSALERGTPFELRDAIDAAALGITDMQFTALLALTETCPWRAGSLARSGRPFLATRADLREARAWCASLALIHDGT